MNTSPFAQDVEKDLLQRAQRGDRQALGEIYQLYSSPVYTLAKRFFPQGADAEDVLQETFITAFEKLQQFQGKSAFGFWLLGIPSIRCWHDHHTDIRSDGFYRI